MAEVPAAPAAPLLTPENPAADHKDYMNVAGQVIAFQKGAMELGRNGWTTEEILDVLIDHLSGFQKGKFACRENAIALTHIETARLWVRERAEKRKAQGVKGRDAVHA
jgi:hypothetical protein